MLKANYFNRFASIALLAAAFSLSPALAGETAGNSKTQTQTNTAMENSVQENAESQVDEKRKTLIGDAISALEKTEAALAALDESNTAKALDELALAIGKLELIVAREPELALAPIDVKLVQRDLMADVKSIEATREEIKDLVDDNKFQEARVLMRGFASELVIETTNLPLATYPIAIKLASAQIDDGNIEEAKRTLRTALQTIMITEDVIPLPLVRAEGLVNEAEAALNAEKPSNDETASTLGAAQRLAPDIYVEAASTQLEIAELLGYGDEKKLSDLRDSLEELEEKIEKEQDTGGLFHNIGKIFDSIRDRVVAEDS